MWYSSSMSNKNKNKDSLNSSKSKTFSGVISISARGVGYLPTTEFEKDIKIEEHDLNTALPDDEVEVSLLAKKKELLGQVVGIKKRARETIVGVIEKKGNVCFVLPDNNRFYRDILIPEPPKDIEDGHKAVVKFLRWDDPKKNPEGQILRILGLSGEHEVEMNSIIIEKGFEVDFPETVEKEARKLKEQNTPIPQKEIESRRDLRETTTLTIDPETAKDFDDALSFKDLGDDKFEIGIHIADVAHFVTEGSAIDKEARRRGTSVYLVDRTIPMLPEVLSNDLCSLNPGEDKLAFSAVFQLNRKGEVLEKYFDRTLIRSDKRFSYKEAEEEMKLGGKYQTEIKTLNEIAKELRKKKSSMGAIEFESDEVAFELDEKGVPTRVYIKEHLETHKLIEEFMLLANREVAMFLDDKVKKQKAIYRIHEKPNPDKLEELFIFLKALGHEFNIKSDQITPRDINKILDRVEGRDEEPLVKTATLRSMSKAIYSTKNIGHFGLAFRHYTHFTSPIRRYPDLIVHRLLWKKIHNQKLKQDITATLKAISQESTEKEIRATEAERESIRMKQVEFMENHIGQTFDAVISGVTTWGLFVEELSTLSNGMIRISNIGDEYFELDEKNYRLIGQKTKTTYSLGQKVKVKLTDANSQQRQLNFVFA